MLFLQQWTISKKKIHCEYKNLPTKSAKIIPSARQPCKADINNNLYLHWNIVQCTLHVIQPIACPKQKVNHAMTKC